MVGDLVAEKANIKAYVGRAGRGEGEGPDLRCSVLEEDG